MNEIIEWAKKLMLEVASEPAAKAAMVRMAEDVCIVVEATQKRLSTAKVLGLSAAVSKAMLALVTGVAHGK